MASAYLDLKSFFCLKYCAEIRARKYKCRETYAASFVYSLKYELLSAEAIFQASCVFSVHKHLTFLYLHNVEMIPCIGCQIYDDAIWRTKEINKSNKFTSMSFRRRRSYVSRLSLCAFCDIFCTATLSASNDLLLVYINTGRNSEAQANICLHFIMLSKHYHHPL